MNTLSLLSGFFVIFIGVFLLDMSRKDPTGHQFVGDRGEGLPTDGLSAIQTRFSMQSQRSYDSHHRRSVSNGSVAFSPRLPRGDRERLMHEWNDEEQAYGLHDLAEDSDGEKADGNPDARINGHHAKRPD